jgi:hypothetical protein
VCGGGEEGEELPQRKKTTSFKITNVFLSRPPSNDGDESNEDCEDMEDSHTEVSTGQCCESGSGIRCFFTPPDPGYRYGMEQWSDPGSGISKQYLSIAFIQK